MNNRELGMLILEKIKENDVISFDIFDTLISRNVFIPNDLFYLVAMEATKKNIYLYPNVFRKCRIEAELKARNESGLEDIELIDIYNKVQYILNLNDEKKNTLMEIETDLEYRFSVQRSSMKDIFDYAKTQGKIIILASDMYLGMFTIKKLLEKAGYTGYSEIYLSSNLKLTKKTGSMFEYIANDIKHKYNTSKICHIGDNYQHDILNARQHNLTALFSAGMHKMYLDSGYPDNLFGKWLKSDFKDMSLSLYCSLVANKYFNKYVDDTKLFQTSLFGNDAHCLGYTALGLLLVGFCDWIINEAKKDKIDTFLFLARDGYLIKQAYDIVSRYYSNPPKSVYLLASRRSFSVPTFYNAESFADIFLSSNFSGSVASYITNRLGVAIDTEVLCILDEIGIDINQKIQLADNYSLISTLIRKLSDKISINAKKELDSMHLYLNSLDVLHENIALVDLGHTGTIPYFFKNITSKDVYSYNVILQRISKDLYQTPKDMVMKGYLFNNIELSNDYYSLSRFNPQLETFFSTDQEQFLKNIISDGVVEHKFIKEDKSRHVARISFVNEIHAGALEFVQDFTQIRDADTSIFHIDNTKATTLLFEHLNNPLAMDLELWSNVYFENNFSGWKDRVIFSRQGSLKSPVLNKELISVDPDSFRKPLMTKNTFISHKHDKIIHFNYLVDVDILFGGSGFSKIKLDGNSHFFSWICDELMGFKIQDPKKLPTLNIKSNFSIIFHKEEHIDVGKFEIFKNNKKLDITCEKVSDSVFALCFNASPYGTFIICNPNFRNPFSNAKDTRRLYWRFMGLKLSEETQGTEKKAHPKELDIDSLGLPRGCLESPETKGESQVDADSGDNQKNSAIDVTASMLCSQRSKVAPD